MNLQLTLNILSKPWLIDANYVSENPDLLINALKGITSDTRLESSTVGYGTMGCKGFEMSAEESELNGANPFENAPEGSIAIINLEGIMMKQNQFCGPVGTETLAGWVNQANAAENIKGLLLKVNSPGGSALAPEVLATAIERFEKPTLTYVNGMMASAALWAGTASDHVMLSGKADMAGSIGTKVNIKDVRKQLEADGTNLIEVLATKSEDKGKAWKEALDGKFESLRSELLDPMNEVFHAQVKSQRAGIKNTALTGKVFIGQQAIEQGIADSIGSMEDALAYLQSKITTQENNISMKDKYPALTAALGEFETTAEGTHLQLEALDALELALNNGSIQATLDELATATASVESLTAERDTAQASLASMTTERNDWQAKAAEYGAKPSSTGATPAAPSEEIENETNLGYERKDDGLSAMMPATK